MGSRAGLGQRVDSGSRIGSKFDPRVGVGSMVGSGARIPSGLRVGSGAEGSGRI